MKLNFNSKPNTPKKWSRERETRIISEFFIALHLYKRCREYSQ